MEEIYAGKEGNSSVYCINFASDITRPELNELMSRREQFQISMQEAWDAALKYFYEQVLTSVF